MTKPNKPLQSSKGRKAGGTNAYTVLRKSISKFIYQSCVDAAPNKNCAEIERAIDLPHIFQEDGRTLSRMVSITDPRPLSFVDARETVLRLQSKGWLKGMKDQDISTPDQWNKLVKAQMIVTDPTTFHQQIQERKRAEAALRTLMDAILTFRKVVDDLAFGSLVARDSDALDSEAVRYPESHREYLAGLDFGFPKARKSGKQKREEVSQQQITSKVVEDPESFKIEIEHAIRPEFQPFNVDLSLWQLEGMRYRKFEGFLHDPFADQPITPVRLDFDVVPNNAQFWQEIAIVAKQSGESRAKKKKKNSL
jgi:hypothetical protein